MQPSQSSAPSWSRAPGSFSPLPPSNGNSPVKNHQPQSAAAKPSSSRRQAPPPLNIESPTPIHDRSNAASPVLGTPTFQPAKTRQRAASPATPIYSQFTAHSNGSATSLQHQNFSRPTGSPRPAAQGASSPLVRGETRKHTATQGMFEPTLPSTVNSNLSQVGAANASHAALTASQIAQQAAVISHHKHSAQHSRQRSQTVPFPGESNDSSRRSSGSKGPSHVPPLPGAADGLPRDAGVPNLKHLQADRSGNANSLAATTAANVVFPRSGHSSPREQAATSPLPPPPPIPASMMEKPMSKSEKAKAKLFSRPVKIGASKENKDRGMPSPGKIGSALSALQRGNFSTSSLVESSNNSLYSLSNSSSATIRPVESAEDKGKEKRHHFLSRQKQKLKDEYHLPLSSASSNSRPTDPHAPSSLYNFNLPSLTGATGGFSKSKKEKKFAERADSRLENDSTLSLVGELNGASGFPSLSQQSTLYDSSDSRVGLGLHAPTSLDEAWPYLSKLLLVIFDGDDLRLPIEDINRMVQMHIQSCILRRTPNVILDDIREFLATGFASLDRTLRATPEDRFLPRVVELWMFTFTSILPFLQSALLPLDLEVSGRGTLLTPEQAKEFWNGVITSPSSTIAPSTPQGAPAAASLDVRQMVLNSFRDIVILPRYDTLRTIFSRLSLEFLPASYTGTALTSPPAEALMSTSPPEYFPPMVRPGTAMSLDPSVASYNSNSTSYFGDSSGGGRSRAVSNVSYGSHGSDGPHRPYTPSALTSVREQNVESSKQVTDMVGRILQCMSVLAGLGSAKGPDDERNKKMAELCKMLKLNWLGRGRTGRNRRGIVGGRVKREDTREEIRVA